MSSTQSDNLETLLSIFPQHSPEVLSRRLSDHNGDLETTVTAILGGGRDGDTRRAGVIEGDEELARRLWEEEVRQMEQTQGAGEEIRGVRRGTGRMIGGEGREGGVGRERIAGGGSGWEGEDGWGRGLRDGVQWVVGGVREASRVVGNGVGELWKDWVVGEDESGIARREVGNVSSQERRDGVVRGGGESSGREGVRRRVRRGDGVSGGGGGFKDD